MTPLAQDRFAQARELPAADSFFGDENGATLGAEEFNESYAEKEGDVIGPYKLRQPIGEGGFGSFWMSELTSEECETLAKFIHGANKACAHFTIGSEHELGLAVFHKAVPVILRLLDACLPQHPSA